VPVWNTELVWGQYPGQGPAPLFGFNVNVIRAQNGPAFDFVIPKLNFSENKSKKLIDVRFDADTKALHSMHVNGVNGSDRRHTPKSESG